MTENIIMGTNNVLLLWKYSKHQISSTVRKLYKNKNYSDVTLVSDEHQTTEAHKSILSACSPVMKSLLLDNPHPHPIVYLRGIESQELDSLIQFIYLGEVQVSQSRLKKFFHAAEELQITDIHDRCDDCDDILGKNEEDKHEPVVDVAHSNSSVPDMFIYKSNARNQVESVKYLCQKCDFFWHDQWDFIRHTESVHKDDLYYCDRCEFLSKTEMGLNNHQQFEHEGERFVCYNCDYQAGTQWDLMQHQEGKNLTDFIKDIFSYS